MNAARASEPDWLRRLQERAHGEESFFAAGAARAGSGRRSAVLMLFGPADEGEDVVLTQRAESMRTHAGQVAFPGGSVDPGDRDPEETALREAAEEIGLASEGVEVLGPLPTIPLSVTGFRVTPVLAWWSTPSPIRAENPAEVARVARIPLRDLVDPAHRFTSVWREGSFAAPAFEVDGLYIWGFTAMILDATLQMAGLEVPWDTEDRRPVPERYLRR